MLSIKQWNTLIVCCCILTALPKNTVDATKRYNVLLVIFDDMRPAISAGYMDKWARTPHLDAFIEQSHYFTRAYSQQALCAPSRNSMLTSRRPDTLHLYDFYSYWRSAVGNFTTLPQYFKEHGYYTHSVGKVFHAGVSSNFTDDYPLSWSQPTYHGRSEKFMNSPVCPDANNILRRNLICPIHLQTQPYKTLPDIEATEEAINFLQQIQEKQRTAAYQPYFLALGIHKPHINLRFPRHFLDSFPLSNFFNYTKQTVKPQLMPNVAWNPYTDVRARDDFKSSNISFPYGPISDLQSAQIRQSYYASIAYVDELFGAVMRQVEQHNTIVLVTSDHGWSLGEHGEWAKYSNFDVALKVPLIIRTPEYPVSGGHAIDSITELLDVFPTVVDLAHLPQLPQCQNQQELSCTQGKSLIMLLQQSGHGPKTYAALSQYPRPGLQPTKYPNSDKPKLQNIKVMGYSLRIDCCRYTLWVQFFTHNFSRNWSEVFGEELYDHRFDAAEDFNLAELPEFNQERLWMREKLITMVDK